MLGYRWPKKTDLAQSGMGPSRYPVSIAAVDFKMHCNHSCIVYTDANDPSTFTTAGFALLEHGAALPKTTPASTSCASMSTGLHPASAASVAGRAAGYTSGTPAAQRWLRSATCVSRERRAGSICACRVYFRRATSGSARFPPLKAAPCRKSSIHMRSSTRLRRWFAGRRRRGSP